MKLNSSLQSNSAHTYNRGDNTPLQDCTPLKKERVNKCVVIVIEMKMASRELLPSLSASSAMGVILGCLLLVGISGAEGTANTATVTSSSGSRFNPIENLFQPIQRPQNQNPDGSNEKKTFQIHHGPDENGPTPEEREAERLARRERNRQRRAKVADAMKKARPDTSKIEKLSEEEINKISENHPQEFRKLWGGSGNSESNLIAYADPGDDYDMWQQAYRMLGGFIDCDHQKSEGSGDGGGSGDGDGQACSRWMMWASVSTSRPSIYKAIK